MFDSGFEDPERVLIFGDRDNIECLILYRDVWLGDRTFLALLLSLKETTHPFTPFWNKSNWMLPIKNSI